MPVRDRSLKPSGTLRGLEWETQPAQSAIIGLPVSYRTYRRDTRLFRGEVRVQISDWVAVKGACG